MDIQNNADSATVITSAGPGAVCAGADVQSAQAFTPNNAEPRAHQARPPLQEKHQPAWTGT